MTATVHSTPQPLSPHLLSTMDEVRAKRLKLWPWQLRREAVASPSQAPERESIPLRGYASLAEAPQPADDTTMPKTVTDVMTRDVISVSTETPVSEIARMLVANRVSALPVVGSSGRLLGIVSESDLIRRSEIRTGRELSWWRRAFPDARAEALDYVRTHGRKARHVMTFPVVTAREDMTLKAVADILEIRRLKRLPVVQDGVLVGIISRSDLVWTLAQHQAPLFAEPPGDDAITRDLVARLEAATPGYRLVNASVHRGNVDLSGLVASAAERDALIVAAENTPGVRSVQARFARWPNSIA